MKIFYGAAIQGNKIRGDRRTIHEMLISTIKNSGYDVASEHSVGSTIGETAKLLTKSLGELPPTGLQRTKFIRNKMIELIEGELSAAIFEVSVPSLGTGIEFAHAYLRPQMNLPEIPILAVYEEGYWPNNLSAMVQGVSSETFPNYRFAEYRTPKEACDITEGFLKGFAGKDS